MQVTVLHEREMQLTDSNKVFFVKKFSQLTERAKNVLKGMRAAVPDAFIPVVLKNYYPGFFLKARACGKQTAVELEKFKYEIEMNWGYLNSGIMDFSPSGSSKYENVNLDTGHEFAFQKSFRLLGNRSKHLLEKIHGDTIQGFIDNVLNDYHLNFFIDLRNCGTKANEELKEFKILVDLIIANRDQLHSKGLFDDIKNQLNDGFLSPVEKTICLNHYQFLNDDAKYLTLEAIAKKHDLTRERIRQYKVSILNKMEELVLSLWNYSNYDVQYFHKDAFRITADSAREINSNESTNYSASFITFVLSCICSPHHTFYSTHKSPRIDGIFLIQITDFKYHKLFDDIKNLASTRRTSDVEFRLENFIPGYYKGSNENFFRDYVSLVEKSIQTFIDILNEETDIVFLEKSVLIFSRTTKKLKYEYIVNALRSKGQPMHFTELFSYCNEGEVVFTSPQSLLSAIINRPKVFGLKGQGIYGLRDWGGYFGSIGDVTEQLITEHGQPISWTYLKDFLARELIISEDSINTVLFFYEGETRFVHKGSKVYLTKWIEE